MLGKRACDLVLGERQTDHGASKRQRITNAEQLHILDLPNEALSRILLLLDTPSHLAVRSSCRRIHQVSLITGLPHVTFSLNHRIIGANHMRKILQMHGVGLINSQNTNVCLRVDLTNSDYTTEPANVACMCLAILHDKCRAATLEVTTKCYETERFFFEHLVRWTGDFWRPTFRFCLKVFGGGDIITESAGAFAKKIGCDAFVAAAHAQHKTITRLEYFSECTIVSLDTYKGLTPEDITSLTSCKMIHLNDCKQADSANVDSVVAAMGRIPSVFLSNVCVSDVGINALIGCKRVAVDGCYNVSSEALRRLHDQGVIVSINGNYWPPPPTPPSCSDELDQCFLRM